MTGTAPAAQLNTVRDSAATSKGVEKHLDVPPTFVVGLGSRFARTRCVVFRSTKLSVSGIRRYASCYNLMLDGNKATLISFTYLFCSLDFAFLCFGRRERDIYLVHLVQCSRSTSRCFLCLQGYSTATLATREVLPCQPNSVVVSVRPGYHCSHINFRACLKRRVLEQLVQLDGVCSLHTAYGSAYGLQLHYLSSFACPGWWFGSESCSCTL